MHDDEQVEGESLRESRPREGGEPGIKSKGAGSSATR